MIKLLLKLAPAILAVIGVLVLAILFADGELSRTEARSHNPVKPTVESIRSGEVLYRKNCKQCHGERAIRSKRQRCTAKFCPADLRCPKLWAKGEDFIYKTITEGRPPMPCFGKKLSDEERWDIVNYLHGLVKEEETNTK